MSKVKIFLADLTHMGMGVATENMPLAIGLIASYAKKIYGESLEIRLFKYPDKLLEALKNDQPNILGSTSYSWNSNLSEWACKKAKQFHPEILTVQGGPHFPSDDLEEQMNFFHQRPHTDIFVRFFKLEIASVTRSTRFFPVNITIKRGHPREVLFSEIS